MTSWTEAKVVANIIAKNADKADGKIDTKVSSIDIVGKNEESVHEGNQKPGSSKIIHTS